MFTRSKKPVININASVSASDLPDFEQLGVVAENNLKNVAIPLIAARAETFWKQQAALRLHTTLDAYIQSISVRKDKYGIVSLTLGGRGGHATAVQRWLAVAMEVGIAGYSLKPGFLRGGLTYRIIPIQTKDKGLIFRTVTNKEQATPWAHPGFKPLNIKDLVIEEIKSVIIPEELTRLLELRKKKKRMK
jgi:hypothetical protein